MRSGTYHVRVNQLPSFDLPRLAEADIAHYKKTIVVSTKFGNPVGEHSF